MWMGGTDEASEGNWAWVSERCSFSTFENWYPEEPSNTRGNEDCQTMTEWRNTNETYAWNDAGCYHVAWFICEFD